LSANADSTFAIWDLRTHKSIAHKHVGAPISAIALSNANTYFAVATDNFFEVYDRKGTLLDRTALKTAPQTLAVSENGTIALGFEKAASQFFQLNRGIKIYPEKPYLNNIAFNAAYFVDNTDQVLMGLQNSFNAQLSDLDDNKVETPNNNYPVIGHSNGVMSVAVAKNPDYLATGSQDKTVILWQKLAGHYHESVVLKGHDNTVEQLAFSPNAQYIASATVNEVKIWLIHCREIAKSPVGPSIYFSLTYLPNTKDSILAGDGVGNIHLINTRGDILKQWRNSTAKIKTLAAFIQYDSITKTPIIKFISGSEDGKVSIWQLKNAQPDTVLLYESEDKKPISVRSIALHNRERDFFTAYADGKVMRRNMKGDSQSSHDCYFPITTIKVVQKSLFIGCENGSIMHLSTQDYANLSSDLIFNEQAPIHSLAVSHNARYVVAGSEHNLKIWDLANPNLTIKPIKEAHNNQISDLQFSSDDKYLFSVGWDKTAYMWVREGYKLSKFYQVSDVDNGSMASLAISPKDNVFVTGSSLASFWRTPQSLAADAIEKRTDIHKFVLMPIAFYKASKDLTVLEEAARKFAEIESYH
jgi:WD40 repeat protein